MITDKDVTKLIDKFTEVFATKYDLDRVEDKIDGLSTRDEVREVKVLVENVLVESKKTSEEQSAHLQEHRDINDRLRDLEAVHPVAHSVSK